MKLYVISGWGADFKVLEKLTFPEHLSVHFIEWKIPKQNESFTSYIKRMASEIDDSNPFALLGYSFGGIVVQEIHKIKPAEKVVILGSIKNHNGKSALLKFGGAAKIPHLLPKSFYNDKITKIYRYFRRFFYRDGSGFMRYFQMKDPYYLKWSAERIVEWKSEENPEIIQILADKDIVFPIKKNNPDYVIQNATHLFPATKHKQVSLILKEIFS